MLFVVVGIRYCGGLLDVSDWDAFVFDAGTIGQATINISGVGTSIGWLMNHYSATDAPFTLATGHLHFDLWGMQR